MGIFRVVGRPISLIMILMASFACGGAKELPTVEQARLDGASFSQSNVLMITSTTATSVLAMMGLADQGDIENSIESPAVKALAIPDLNCSEQMQASLPRPPRGSISVAGSCAAAEGEDCVYEFSGGIFFSRLITEADDLLSGSLAVNLQLTFPGCVPDLTQARIAMVAEGLVGVEELRIEFLSASFGGDDPSTGDIDPVLVALTGLSTYFDLRCVTTVDGSSCFFDKDGDLDDDETENCPLIANPSQSDTDGDGVGDLCDNCPVASNADQADSDADGVGDACFIGFCSEGVLACDSPDICPVDRGCSEAGCCAECVLVEPTQVSLTCRQAEAINETGGLSGGCENFHSQCDPSGCCQLQPPPDGPLEDLCGADPVYGYPFCGIVQTDEFGNILFDEFGNFDAGFCTPFFYSEVCVQLVLHPELECPEIVEGAGVAVNCEFAGQLACNAMVAQGFVATATCNGTCCVGTPVPPPPTE